MELDGDLIDAWKYEIAVMVQRFKSADATELMRKKADFLEGAYSLLTCLERAMSGERSPNPLGQNRPK